MRQSIRQGGWVAGGAYELTDRQGPEGPSSRRSARWAGWSRDRRAYDAGAEDAEEQGAWTWARDDAAHGAWEARLEERIDRRWGSFSWLSTRALLDSANDQIVKMINDLVGPRRQRWIAAQRAAGADVGDFVIDKTDWRSVLILGDPGEADGSQYAVVDPMLSVDAREEVKSDCMVVLSDVIYPAGDINDYVNGFYLPFQDYRKPIFGLPGNHDWYDGLNGFMRTFCGAEPLPPTEYRASSFTFPERIARLLWRQASRPNRTRLLRHRSLRQVDSPWTPVQPAPYFAIDIAGVRLVAIDTGIGGTIDAEQGEWLCRVSRGSARPKVLLTGKPIWVDGDYKPTPIEWEAGEVGPHHYETVDDVVRDPQNRYVSAIGGDTHNYQRFTITVEGERRHECRADKSEAVGHTRRRIEYVVSGGAGAYTSATHRIPYVHRPGTEGPTQRARRRAHVRRHHGYKKAKYEPPTTVLPVGEEQFRSYPLRGDSLAYYARWFGPRLAGACALATAAALACALALILWDSGGGRIGGRSVGSVLAAAVWVPVAAALVIAGAVFMARLAAPRGYRTISVLIVVPAVVAAAVAFHPEDWRWPVLLITVGVVVLPVLVTVAAYYGLGSDMPGSAARMPRHLAIGLLVAAEVLILVPGLWPDTGAQRVIAVAAAVGIAWLVMNAIARFGKRAARFISRWPPLAWFALMVAVIAPVAAPVVRFWDAGAAPKIVVVAVALVIILLALALLGWVAVNNGWAALLRLHLWRARVDPNEAIAYVNSRYGSHEAGTARAAPSVSAGTRAVGKLLLPRDGKKRSINSFISEAGNADEPPMFKNFLHVSVSEDRRWLEITCYGVTGWRAHDGRDGRPVPKEDAVRIDLDLARGAAGSRDGEVHLGA